MTMITPSAQLTLTKGNKSWVPGDPLDLRRRYTYGLQG